MAELADAQRSGRCMDFHVQVRLLSTASQFTISSIGSRQYVYGLNFFDSQSKQWRRTYGDFSIILQL